MVSFCSSVHRGLCSGCIGVGVVVHLRRIHHDQRTGLLSPLPHGKMEDDARHRSSIREGGGGRRRRFLRSVSGTSGESAGILRVKKIPEKNSANPHTELEFRRSQELRMWKNLVRRNSVSWRFSQAVFQFVTQTNESLTVKSLSGGFLWRKICFSEKFFQKKIEKRLNYTIDTTNNEDR